MKRRRSCALVIPITLAAAGGGLLLAICFGVSFLLAALGGNR